MQLTNLRGKTTEYIPKRKEYQRKWYKNHREEQREYYKNHREEIKEYYKNHREEIKEYYKNHREEILKWRKEYYKNHREYIRNYQREWRKNHPEWRKEYYKNHLEHIRNYQREYDKNHLEHIRNIKREYNKNHLEHTNYIRREYDKNRRKKDPKYRLNQNMSCEIYKALKGKKAGKQWKDLTGYTTKDLKEHLEKQFTPEMNWENHGSYWHVDHIKPKSLFKYNSPDDPEFKQCWSLENLQPLESIENLKKSNHYNEPS